MSARKTVRGYLTCSNHGSEKAEQICGACGKPVCNDCSTTTPDVTLVEYRKSGFAALLLGLGFLVLVPLVLSLLPPIFWRVFSDLAGKPLYIPGGLQTGSILVGIALLAGVRYRVTGDGFQLFNLQLLTRQVNLRTVCEDCYPSKRAQKWFAKALFFLGSLVVLYGLYLSFSQLFFRHLRIVGAGIALLVVREDIVAVTFDLVESQRS